MDLATPVSIINGENPKITTVMIHEYTKAITNASNKLNIVSTSIARRLPVAYNVKKALL